MHRVLSQALCILAALLPAQAAAQEYPSKSVRMVVGFPPGGGTDILARIVAQKLADAWGQSVVVVNPAVPVKDVAELVALAKSKPGKLTFASSGAGSLQHIAAEVFRSAAGVDLVHVPYKGSGQAVIDLISGHVDMNFDSIPAVIQHVKSGKVRAIAVTAKKRASGLPDVPAIAESGYPDYDLTTWWGLFAPAGTPPDIVAKIHRDTLAVLQNAEVKERFATLSVDPGGGTSREFATYVSEEIAKYDALVKRLNIKTE